MGRATQVKLSLNAHQIELLTRWGEANGYDRPSTWATYLFSKLLEDANERGDIPPAEPDANINSHSQDDYDILVNLVALLAEGADPSPTAIAQAARVARVSPHALHSALEKRKNGNGEHINK